MKRHESLHPLSHHHTNALHVALKLRRVGTDKARESLDEVINDLDDFWNPAGQEHFREEEEVLLGTYAEYVDISTVPEVQEMLIEHIQIRARINQILRAEEPDLAFIRELGEFLNDHIRKEERVIFPMIEQAIPDERLVELAEYIHEV
ncbi:MAG TPA: hemerythrin domain-containing protein [Candidatus Avamphibacillus intestinigallinarum]|nr:hemerythrin domain-containing protein [Candidatus Avamphibacillus intestinigallinarum]